MYVCVHINGSETGIKHIKLQRFAVYVFCTLPSTIPKGMLSQSSGSWPGLCQADRESRQKDSKSQITLNQTVGSRRGEEGAIPESEREWREEDEKHLPGGVGLWDRRACAGGLGVTRWLGCSLIQSVIKAALLQTSEIWLLSARTCKDSNQRFPQSHTATRSRFLLPFTHAFSFTPHLPRSQIQLFPRLPPIPAHSKLCKGGGLS